MSLKVLLADDSMTAQNMAKKILADSGYEVTTVSNGAAAVKKIAEVKPDLVILDIYMPGYTGLEVCERVRANLETTNIPVLLTVGKMEPYRPEDGARVRADGIIVKPFEATDLLEIVKKISEKFAPARKTPAASYDTVPATVDEFSEPAEEARVAPPVEVPLEMAVAPAMAFEDVPNEIQWAPSPAAVADELKSTASFSMEPPPPPPPPPPPVSFTPAYKEAEPGVATDSMPAFVDDAPAPSFQVEAMQPLPEIEFNAAPPQDIRVEQASDLEPTVRSDEIQLPPMEADPALVTESDELAKFTTSFGVENAEDVPVGTVTGDEAFLAPEQVFTSGASQEDEPVVQETEIQLEPMVEQTAAERPTSAPSLDDFEARVAAAMSAFDEPVGESAVQKEPVVEQVDNFIGDPEIVNPVSVEPAEPAPMAEFTEAWSKPVEPATPAPETRTLDVDETMVLPAEALLSLEAEMRKAMELRKAAEPEAPSHLQVMDDITGPETEESPEETQKLEALEEIAPEPEAPSAMPDDDDFAARVNAALSEVSPEPPSQPEPVAETQVPPMAMAAATAVAPAVAKWNGVGEEKLASAVQTAVERLKPQLIAEIVKALKGE